MKLPFPSRQPSILHSSPLWLLACSSGMSQVSVGAVKKALHMDKLLTILTKKKKKISPFPFSFISFHVTRFK